MIYFSHIPKTAGTTLRAFLSQFFDDARILPHQLWHELGNPQEIKWENYDLVTGHFGHGLVEYLPTGSKVITMLRHPIERTISQYNHVMRDNYYEHKLGDRVISKIGNGDFSKMLDDPQCAEYFSNIQLKFINLSCKPSGGMVSFGNWKEVVDIYNSGEKQVSLAQERLSSYHFVGIQEYFAQSYLLLSFIEGFHPYYDGTRRMVIGDRPKVSELSDSLLQKIDKINILDKHLYDFAVTRFIEAYSNMLQQISNHLGATIPDFSDVVRAKDLLVKYQENLRTSRS